MAVLNIPYPDSNVSKVIKKSQPFILGFCACGCNTEINIRSGHSFRRYISGHNSKGENNPAWKGGIQFDKHGYELVYSPNHPNRDSTNLIRKHRLVMEQHLGRLLTKKEVIHHIDDNPKNNDISNLKLYSNNVDHLKDNHTMKDMSSRFCLKCESKTTQNRSDGSNRPHWIKYRDGYQCRMCYNISYRKQRLGLI